jgi:hypothetical protein
MQSSVCNVMPGEIYDSQANLFDCCYIAVRLAQQCQQHHSSTGSSPTERRCMAGATAVGGRVIVMDVPTPNCLSTAIVSSNLWQNDNRHRIPSAHIED